MACMVQIGAYDCRHSAQVIANVCTQKVLPNKTLHIWVYEEAPEILARHMLLLSVLLDSSLPVRQRTELFTELHANACIQATTAEYLGELCRKRSSSADSCLFRYTEPLIHAEKQARILETVTLESSAGDPASNGNMLAELFDLSLIRFQQRDDIAEAFRKCSRKVGSCHATAAFALLPLAPGSMYSIIGGQTKQSKLHACLYRQSRSFASVQVPYDMPKAWEARSRKFYGPRYDFKRNAVSACTCKHCCSVSQATLPRFGPLLKNAETTQACIASVDI